MIQVRAFSNANFLGLESDINTFYQGSTTHILISVSFLWEGSTFRALCVEQEVS